MQGIALSAVVLFGGVALLTLVQDVESAHVREQDDLLKNPDDEFYSKIGKMYLLDLLVSLEHDLLAEKELANAQKRSDALDFGMARGHIGASAVKQNLGMTHASNPFGPGRKRSSVDGFSF